jgi:hypothetical protein
LTPPSFLETATTALDHWRSIVLLGANVMSYKFALAKTLLGFSDRGGTLLRLDDLAAPFARHLCEHLQRCDKQGTSRSSKFLDGLREFNAGGMAEDELVTHTARLGFQNVIDAFHNLPGGESPTRFYIDRRREPGGGGTDRPPEQGHYVRAEACLADAPARAQEVLAEDLTAPRYEQRSDGRLMLEAKSSMKRWLGRSPDDSDVLALALAQRTRRSIGISLRVSKIACELGYAQNLAVWLR